MQIGASQAGGLKAQVATSVQKQAQSTDAQNIDKIMSGSLEGSANQARASQGVGTQLNIVA